MKFSLLFICLYALCASSNGLSDNPLGGLIDMVAGLLQSLLGAATSGNSIPSLPVPSLSVPDLSKLLGGLLPSVQGLLGGLSSTNSGSLNLSSLASLQTVNPQKFLSLNGVLDSLKNCSCTGKSSCPATIKYQANASEVCQSINETLPVQIKITVDFTGNEKCKDLLNLGCKAGQVPELFTQLNTLLPCLLGNVTKLLNDTLSNLGGALQKEYFDEVKQSLLILLIVTFNTVREAICVLDIHLIAEVLPCVLVEILTGLMNGLDVLGVAIAPLLALVTVVLTILVNLLASPLASVVNTLRGPLIMIVNTLTKALINYTVLPCAP